MSEEKTPFSEEALRDIAAKKVSYKRSVRIHWAVYLLVNTLLFIVNSFVINWAQLSDQSAYGMLQSLWAIYPLLGWFIGLSVHTVAYLMYANGVAPMAKRGVVFHITAYFTVMLLLWITNYITLPEFYWVIFPAIFWGAGVIVHVILYIIYFSGEVTDSGELTSKKERAIEKEMEKMRKKME